MFSSASEPTNFNGPSAIGLKNRFLSGLYTAIIPDLLQIAIKYLSPRSIIDSVNILVAPCAIKTSRSISPILKPPSFALPLTGCLVNAVRGPFVLKLILSFTICFKRI